MRIVLSVLFVALLAGTAAAAERVNDAEHGFTLVVPDGFVDAPQAMGPKVLHAYQRGTAPEPGFAFVQLQTLGGTIGREPIDRAVAEKAARAAAAAQGAELSGFAYRRTRWKGFDLDLMVVTMGAGDLKVVTLAAQVPLARQALQVQIVGPATDEARLEQDLEAFLAGLDGKSSWLSDGERSEALGRAVGGGVGLLLGLGGLLWWKRRKRVPAVT